MIRSFKTRTLSALAVAMILPVAAFAAHGTAAKASTATKAHMTTHAKRPPAVDINSASKEALMNLPGVTEETAQKIIDGRPYKTKSDLTKKQILTRAEYTKVRGRVIAKHGAKAPEVKSMESTPGSK